MRAFAAASCCAAVVLADNCPANSNMCSCFDPTDDNILEWRKVLTFNTCCATCVVNAAVENGCLENNSCGYDEAKAVFEACGSEDWDDDEPENFLPPQSCEFFPATADNIVNWRTAVVREIAPAFCLSCVTGKLGALTPSTSAFTAQETQDAFEGCGLAAFPTLDTAQEDALVFPQSRIACDNANGGVPELTVEQLVDWRTVLPDFPECAGCILARLRGGEYAYNSYEGVGGALVACGYEYDLPSAAPEDFVPPGCANFATGGSADYGGIVAWDTAGTEPIDQCTVCAEAWANGTAKDAPKPYPGECVPGTEACTYDQTANAFNYCGTGGDFSSSGNDPWPIPEPAGITPQLL